MNHLMMFFICLFASSVFAENFDCSQISNAEKSSATPVQAALCSRLNSQNVKFFSSTASADRNDSSYRICGVAQSYARVKAEATCASYAAVNGVAPSRCAELATFTTLDQTYNWSLVGTQLGSCDSKSVFYISPRSTTRLSFTIDADFYAKLQNIAKSRGLNLDQLVLDALKSLK